MILNFEHFVEGYKNLSSIINPTPLVYNEWLSRNYQCEIYLKLENMLPIGSFKMRGATHKISKLTSADKKRGVLAVSAGNHAQGVAWAAKHFGLNATIIMPEASPLTKIRNTELLGAKVILHGKNIEEGFLFAQELMKKKKMVFVHPFYDPDVIAGQGSVAFEIFNQIDDVDFLFSSIGGGGLVSGIGQVVKGLGKKTKIMAGQSIGYSGMVQSLDSQKILNITPQRDTFADGIKVRKVEPEMFQSLSSVVDTVGQVSDDKMAWAILQLMEKARIISEGAGALPLAFLDDLYQKNPEKFHHKKIVLVICGGNIDVNLLERIIDTGLVESRRKVKISVPIEDRPGLLHHLTGVIKNLGCNILHVVHERGRVGNGIKGTDVIFTLETKGPSHMDEVLKEIKKDFPQALLVNN